MNQSHSPLSQALSRAVAAYSAGQLVAAEQLCQQLVGTEPNFFEALHLLAIVQSRLGKKGVALASFDRALQAQPNSAEALFNRGVTLHELRRFAEALASYDRALALRPSLAAALYNRGNTLREMKRREEALASYDRALALRPDFLAALYNRGIVLHQLDRWEEALASYDRVLAVQPDHAEALCNRGLTLHALKRFDAALESYDRALAVRPDYAEALCNRSVTLHELARFDAALASYDRALAVRPNYAEAHFNRGLTLHKLARFDEALASYDRAIAVRPDYAEAFSNRAVALHGLKRFADALASYDRALDVRPDYAEALSNRGVTLHELARFDEALASYDRALALRPDYAEAHFNEALCRLLIGDFDGGFEKNEWRWQTENLKGEKRSFAQPQWTGSDEIARRTVLLHAEQGFGDTIQFCRYVPRVAARGARVIVEVQRPLQALMSALPGAAQVVARGDPLPDFDMHCPLLSLPLAFATRLASIPADTPYLFAAESKRNAWRDRLGRHGRPRVGLVWAGAPRKWQANAAWIDRQRSIAFDQLAPIFQIAECDFYSLQKGDDALAQLRSSPLRQRVIDWTEDLHDFSDTAALLDNLDLVITVDTAVAHLAGALAKPFWLLNRYNTCWRWLLDRDDSPWYPTARLFRQDATRAWDGVIARVRDALGDFVRS